MNYLLALGAGFIILSPVPIRSNTDHSLAEDTPIFSVRVFCAFVTWRALCFSCLGW